MSFLKYMVICLSLTILIEVIVSLIIGIRNKKDLVNIILVNILTNPLLVSFVNLISMEYGLTISYIALFIFEVIVVFVEGFIYKKYLIYNKINYYVLSFILNLCSYFIGYFALKLIK